jgi:hypothetical protein
MALEAAAPNNLFTGANVKTFGLGILVLIAASFSLHAANDFIPIESISGSIAPYVDKDGYINPIINLGEIDLGDGIFLPLSLNFSSAIRPPSPEFGQGWECPLFDAKVFDTQHNVKRMETLGGKDRFLVYNPRIDSWRHVFTDNWDGKVDGDYFDATYCGGAKFVFYKGLISSIVLPDGKTILWNRENGKLVSLQVSGLPPALQITYDKLGFAQQILLQVDKTGKAKQVYNLSASLIYAGIDKIECPNGRNIRFEEGHDKSLNPMLKWTDSSFAPLIVHWNAKTGKILSDNYYTYQITELNKDDTWPKMDRTNKTNHQVESYYFNQNNGITDQVLPGGVSRHIEMIESPSPNYKAVRLIQDTHNGVTQTLLRRAYDDKGHLILEAYGLAGGKQVTRQFTYDDSGRVASYLLNGKEKWKNIYDPSTGQLIERDVDDLGVKLAFEATTGGEVKESIINANGDVRSTKTLTSTQWQTSLASMQRDF